jgi:hypothetical protein
MILGHRIMKAGQVIGHKTGQAIKSIGHKIGPALDLTRNIVNTVDNINKTKNLLTRGR